MDRKAMEGFFMDYDGSKDLFGGKKDLVSKHI
jgi:hypothetical protein